MDFLGRLRKNNNREWFEQNRAQYSEVLEIYHNFAQELLTQIALFDPDAAPLGVKDCTYRIYRDLRFSPNKEPYKTALGVYVCRGGKKTGYGGYYIHFEPQDGESGGCFMTSGVYMPEPFILRSIREEIIDNGAAIRDAISSATGFTLSRERELKKNPVGFTPGHEFDDYLKQRDFFITKPIDMEYVTAPGLAERAAEDFSMTYPLLKILNRAVEYAYEENGN